MGGDGPRHTLAHGLAPPIELRDLQLRAATGHDLDPVEIAGKRDGPDPDRRVPPRLRRRRCPGRARGLGQHVEARRVAAHASAEEDESDQRRGVKDPSAAAGPGGHRFGCAPGLPTSRLSGLRSRASASARRDRAAAASSCTERHLAAQRAVHALQRGLGALQGAPSRVGHPLELLGEGGQLRPEPGERLLHVA